jgi:hypothetical protein
VNPGTEQWSRYAESDRKFAKFSENVNKKFETKRRFLDSWQQYCAGGIAIAAVVQDVGRFYSAKCSADGSAKFWTAFQAHAVLHLCANHSQRDVLHGGALTAA